MCGTQLTWKPSRRWGDFLAHCQDQPPELERPPRSAWIAGALAASCLAQLNSTKPASQPEDSGSESRPYISHREDICQTATQAPERGELWGCHDSPTQYLHKQASWGWPQHSLTCKFRLRLNSQNHWWYAIEEHRLPFSKMFIMHHQWRITRGEMSPLNRALKLSRMLLFIIIWYNQNQKTSIALVWHYAQAISSSPTNITSFSSH